MISLKVEHIDVTLDLDNNVELTISNIDEVAVELSTSETDLSVSTSVIDLKLDPGNSVPVAVYEQYKGDYDITPCRGADQVLKTNNKVMLDDVTIKEIPYSQVSNLAGGTTCYIGKEVI